MGSRRKSLLLSVAILSALIFLFVIVYVLYLGVKTGEYYEGLRIFRELHEDAVKYPENSRSLHGYITLKNDTFVIIGKEDEEDVWWVVLYEKGQDNYRGYRMERWY